MSMKSLLNYLKVALCGSASIMVKDYFIAIPGTAKVELFIYPPLAAVLFYILLTLFFYLPYNFRFIRKYLKDEAKFEGEWLEEVKKDEKEYYSHFNIQFSWLENAYSVSGVAYDTEGEVHANWNSISIYLDKKQKELKYIQIAKMPDKDDTLGLTNLSFFKEAPIEGQGYYYDLAAEKPIRGSFRFFKICKKDIEKKLNYKIKKVRPEDMKKYIRIYHQHKIASKKAA